MDKEGLKKAMYQAQEMQFGLLKIQDELSNIEVSGFSKDKSIEVVMTAQGDPKKVKIQDTFMSKSPKDAEKAVLEALEDVTHSCADAAKQKVHEVSRQVGIGEDLPQ